MRGCGVPGVKATKDRWTEVLLLEGSTMNHRSSALGLETTEAGRLRKIPAGTQGITGHKLHTAKAEQATEGKAPYS